MGYGNEQVNCANSRAGQPGAGGGAGAAESEHDCAGRGSGYTGQLMLGERVADHVASFGGSWKFGRFFGVRWGFRLASG